MLRPPIRVSKPAIFPVTVQEAARACRIEAGEADDALALEIEVATDRLDGYRGSLGRALINQTWRRDYVPDGRNLDRLPFPDVSQVSGEVFGWGSVGTLADLIFGEDVIGPFVRVERGSVPVTSVLRVTFTAGYGPDREDVPAAIRQANLRDVAHRFQANTEDGRIRSETVEGVATTAFTSPEQMGFDNWWMIADVL